MKGKYRTTGPRHYKSYLFRREDGRLKRREAIKCLFLPCKREGSHPLGFNTTVPPFLFSLILLNRYIFSCWCMRLIKNLISSGTHLRHASEERWGESSSYVLTMHENAVEWNKKPFWQQRTHPLVPSSSDVDGKINYRSETPRINVAKEE